MRGWRTSSRGLAATVGVCAVGFGALRSSSELAFNAFYTGTAAAMLLATLAARGGSRSSRAFWFGFAAFGWFAFLQGALPGTTRLSHYAQMDEEFLNRNLLTTRGILELLPWARMRAERLDQVSTITLRTLGVLHLIAVWAFAACGGLLSHVVSERGRGRRRPARDRAVAGLALAVASGGLAALAVRDGSGVPPAGYFPENATLAGDPAPAAPPGAYAAILGRTWAILGPMGEPSIFARSLADPGAEAFRMSWSPSDDYPVAIRVERTADGATLRCVVLERIGDGRMGGIAIDREARLTSDQWVDLMARVRDSLFWEMSVAPRAGRPEADGNSQVWVEGIRGGRYHLVDRREANEDFQAIGRFLIEASGIDPSGSAYNPTRGPGFH